ncbi:MAG: hypothetical protein WCL16_12130 [bacterium]
MNTSITAQNRRFTCISPTLVRVEYAPDGVFEERRSIVAFKAVSRDGAWDVLEAGFMQIRTTDNGKACHRLNLEIRWSEGRLMQFWRPGDRDYQNLGGTVRSLDRYGGAACALDGVHPATMEPPEPSGTHWPTRVLHCEVDQLYEKLHPRPPPNLNQGDWLRAAQGERNDGRFLERTFNWYKDARRFCPGEAWSHAA